MFHRVPALFNSLIQAFLLLLGTFLLTLQGLSVVFVYAAPQGAFPWAQSSQGAESGGTAESQFLRSPSPFLCQVGAYILLCVLSPISAGVLHRVDSSRLSIKVPFLFSEALILLIIFHASHFGVIFMAIPALLLYHAFFSIMARPPVLGEPLSVADPTLFKESFFALIPELLKRAHGASESIPEILGNVHGAAGTLLAVWRRERRPGRDEEMEEREEENAFQLQVAATTHPYTGRVPPPYEHVHSPKALTLIDDTKTKSSNSQDLIILN